ncbi:MAG: PAS domain S-box protein [Gammaproteobacteria bacterium]|nr:PAS domain S-box protein [Gammaproteobacteria bacterium]MCB1860909.1 PAS domain S-box protein [Gammaproteobacteria bacterium]MCB1871686.1 PAS domain S-box protein [Gammaproteobacteria bacterium]MCB1878999.1 PAS domain S-box protein [Gammaproteobacteria bacterium]MCB1905108.1 PAS domain S-box protein [Gammaproteobacteria bacterium]
MDTDGKSSAELESENAELQRRLAALAQIDAARLEAEKRLWECEEKYRNTMDAGLVGIYVIQDLVFRYVNPKMAEMFGYQAAELENKLSPADLVVPELRERIRNNLKRRAEGEPGIPYEIKCQRKDGTVFDATVWGKATTFNGNPASVGTLADTTALNNAKRELRRYQQELEQKVESQTRALKQSNERLKQDIASRKILEGELYAAKELAERASLAKTRFLAAANHDLRQPLQAFSLLISALLLTPLDDRAAQIAKDMRSTLQVMETLLNSLLDISKLDAGVFQPDLRHFAVRPFLQELRNQFRTIAEEQGTRIRLFPSEAIIYTDPSLLARIVQNLISNAVRHTPGGKVLIGCRRAGEYLRLEVWDQGEGIPADQLEIIFEEFYQLGNPARNRNQGLGLGLAIAKRMADLLKLRLHARSRLERGSVFSVTVPLGSGAGDFPPQQVIPDSVIGIGCFGTLLLVDDDEHVVKASTKLLELWGYRVLPAADAIQALALCKHHGAAIEMALLDYRLPDGWTGVRLAAKIREVLGRNLPSLLLTGDTSAQQLQDVYSSGLPLLHKPIDPDELHRHIAAVLHPL